MRRAWLAIGVAACGGKAASSDETLGNQAEEGPVRVVSDASWVDCPDGVAGRYAQELERDEFEEVRVGRCLPGRFGDAMLAVYIEVGPPEDSQAETGTSVWIALLAADGTERAKGDVGGYDWMSGPAGPLWLVDLDGDGIDEIVEHQTGPGWQVVDVLRRSGAEVSQALRVPPWGEESEEPAPAERCALDVRIDGRTLVVTATDDPEFPPIESDDSSCDGAYRYDWQGTAFAVTPPEGE